jgi:hypothetical protein
MEELFNTKFIAWLRPWAETFPESSIFKYTNVVQKILDQEGMTTKTLMKMFSEWCTEEHMDIVFRRDEEALLQTPFLLKTSIAKRWKQFPWTEEQLETQFTLLEELIRLSGICETTSAFLSEDMKAFIQTQRHNQKFGQNRGAMFAHTMKHLLFDPKQGYFQKMTEMQKDPKALQEMMSKVQPLLQRTTRHKDAKVNQMFQQMTEEMVKTTTDTADAKNDDTESKETEAKEEVYLAEVKDTFEQVLNNMGNNPNLQMQDIIQGLLGVASGPLFEDHIPQNDQDLVRANMATMVQQVQTLLPQGVPLSPPVVVDNVSSAVSPQNPLDSLD